jgi:hypothetical protein
MAPVVTASIEPGIDLNANAKITEMKEIEEEVVEEEAAVVIIMTNEAAAAVAVIAVTAVVVAEPIHDDVRGLHLVGNAARNSKRKHKPTFLRKESSLWVTFPPTLTNASC